LGEEDEGSWASPGEVGINFFLSNSRQQRKKNAKTTKLLHSLQGGKQKKKKKKRKWKMENGKWKMENHLLELSSRLPHTLKRIAKATAVLLRVAVGAWRFGNYIPTGPLEPIRLAGEYV
jgi:hypothetical protein